MTTNKVFRRVFRTVTIYYKDKERTIKHRENGPAKVYVSGNKEWYKNGKLHREDGPAIELVNGHKAWFINGLCHREDGPAVEWQNGKTSYYLDDILYSEERFLEEMNIRKRFKGFI